MYIPNKTYAEKGMSITYENIRTARENLDRKLNEREFELQQYAKEICREYTESLAIGKQSWTDSSGKNHAYVKLGVIANGEFVHSAASCLKMDSDRVIHFAVSTIVNDDEVTGGDAYILRMHVRAHGNRVYVGIAGYPEEITTSGSDGVGDFLYVSSVMKSVVLRGLIDPRLD